MTGVQTCDLPISATLSPSPKRHSCTAEGSAYDTPGDDRANSRENRTGQSGAPTTARKMSAHTRRVGVTDAKLPTATWSMFTLRNNCGRDAVAGQNISARLGTRWEPPALVTALGGLVLLACAPLHLQKHSGVLVARIRMHAWGSRGRGFKSRRPDDFSNTCGPNWDRTPP